MARKIQPRSKVPKPKKGQSSEDYWQERESRQRAENIRNEAKTAERINRIFHGMQDSIQQEIEAFYQRYASKESITLTEARGRVSRIDMEQYERLAKKYVEAAHHGDEDLAFSQEANDQMRLYNATMRINRLEMLKARCGIRAMEGYRDTERLINENLEERAYSEYSRLAGILGNSVQFNENMVRAIVNASYQNATWSQRLWNHQASLSSQIGTQLASGILAGKSSTVLAREIQKLTGGSTYACQRLMRTELRRVQTEAALQSMTDNGVTEYKFIVANGVNPCEECLALDGQVFKLSEMAPGKNAPPVHPSCHCCTAPYVDEAKWQRWLDGPAQAGVPWAEYDAEHPSDPPPGGSTLTDGQKLRRTMVNNQRRDQEQLGKYQKILGDEAPQSLEEFQKIKYNDKKSSYGWLKHMYRIANQYEFNSGWMPASKITELHDEAVKQKALFNSAGRNGSNMGVMQFDNNKYFANSRATILTDPVTESFVRKGGNPDILILATQNKRFATKLVDHYRGADSERKLFEFASKLSDDGKTHDIYLLSEKAMCDSCKYVMEQFKKRHPNVNVNVVSHRSDRSEVNKKRNRVFEFDVKKKVKQNEAKK